MITDKAEIKIAMLAVYAAFAVEIDAANAQECILATGEINTFDCQECERELAEEGLISYCTVEGRLCCGITDAGCAMYEQGSRFMRKDLLDAVVSKALRHFEYISTRKKYSSELSEADGGYYVVCSLKSKDRTYMETKFFFDNRTDAFAALDICNESPETIFNGVETLMTGKIKHLL